MLPRNATGSAAPATAGKPSAGEVAFGVLLLAFGGLITAAVSNPLEFAVYLGGPVLALFGLAFVVRALALRLGAAPIVFGGLAFVFGSLLAVHDFLFAPGIATFIHLGIGIATLVLGILQLARKKRYYARWFGKAGRQG